jgi:polysaccharide chain length determinant protein (PEP-CTERM system associated)
MLPGKQYTPIDYATMAWRWRWVILVPCLIGAYVALVVSSRMSTLYLSEMLIQVVPQRVPDAYVKSTVTMKTVDRLSALSEQIMSRTELERLVVEMNLYPDLRQRLPMQDVVDQMRTKIRVDPIRERNQDADSFYVRFSYPEPTMARSVTERLGGLFIDVNARDRGNLAQATNSFLETQLDDARKNLETQENRLKDFRERFAGRLPTQLDFNMNALQNAQARAQTLIESLARDRDQKLLLQTTYAELSAQELPPPPAPPTPVVPATPQQTSQTTTPAMNGTTKQNLEQARAALSALEMRLKPEHPDVVRTKSAIASLEAKLAEETKLALAAQQAAAEAAAAAAAAANPPTPTPTITVGPPALTPAEIARRDRLQTMRGQIESLERQITFKEAEEQRVRASIEDLQRRIEQIPGVESEWVSLTRDYATQQSAYQQLLSKSQDAKLAANLEQRQIGEQFRILDPPRTPNRPVGVARLETNGIGTGIGLAIGLILAGLMELRDRTFRKAGDITEVLQLPVIALVPRVISPEERRRARVRGVLVSAAAMVVGLVGAYGFWTMQLWKFVV